jgi:uncharacterized protein DUF2490
MNKLILFFLLSTGLSTRVTAQENYRAGTLTQVNVNFSLPKNFKLNTKLESRQIFSEKETSKLRSNRVRYERTDAHMILTKKVSADNTFGGGYLIRLEEGKFAHRLIQQFNSVRKLDVASLAHRIVLDETFQKNEPVEIRLRYRLGLEKALNGRSVDPREFYLKVNNEYLGIFSKPNTDLEIRASAALGYNATDDNKIELGLEYRVNEFYTAAKAQQFWITIAWYLSV